MYVRIAKNIPIFKFDKTLPDGPAYTNSVYMDSTDLSCYYNRLRRVSEAFLIRLRWWGCSPNFLCIFTFIFLIYKRSFIFSISHIGIKVIITRFSSSVRYIMRSGVERSRWRVDLLVTQQMFPGFYQVLIVFLSIIIEYYYHVCLHQYISRDMCIWKCVGYICIWIYFCHCIYTHKWYLHIPIMPSGCLPKIPFALALVLLIIHRPPLLISINPLSLSSHFISPISITYSYL